MAAKLGYDPFNELYQYEIDIAGMSPDEVGQLIWDGMEVIIPIADPFPLAKRALIRIDSLQPEDPITIVTARPKYLAELTMNWLDRHFPHHCFEVIFAKDQEKIHHLVTHGFSAFVEDRLRNANEIAEKLPIVYLVEQQYNTGRKTHPNVERVYSVWDAAQDFSRRRLYQKRGYVDETSSLYRTESQPPTAG